LEGRAGIILNVYRRPFGFKEKLARAADTETIVRSAGSVANFDGIFVNYVFICLGIALFIIDVPAQSLEEWIKKFTADLGFIVVAGFVGFAVTLKTLDKIKVLAGERPSFLHSACQISIRSEAKRQFVWKKGRLELGS
jgi:hypothetical protein